MGSVPKQRHFYGLNHLYYITTSTYRPPGSLTGCATNLWVIDGRVGWPYNPQAVVTALKKLHPRAPEAQHEVRKAIAYFQTNAHRMRYAEFRRQGFFVGSGVVEAGCKTLIGLPLKQSGMYFRQAI